MNYYWKDPAKTKRKQFGLLAQEVEVVLELVDTRRILNRVNYIDDSALIEAIKALHRKMKPWKNEQLKTKPSFGETGGATGKVISIRFTK